MNYFKLIKWYISGFMKLELNELNAIYQEVRKNTKNKKKIYQFEVNKMQNFEEIKQKLINYDGGKYNIFLITNPKMRIVMSQNIQDKVINHYVTRYILIKNLEKYLDDRNVATRKKKGTDYAIKLLKKHLEKNKKYERFYILKIDISKYFYSIHHETLCDMLKQKLTEEEFDIVKRIIDSTDEEYINKNIEKMNEKYNVQLPLYLCGRGLPIGNVSSQFLSVFYLYELDHKIIHDLKIKYYIRYLDDFLLIHPDKKYLQKILEEVTCILNQKYHLKINSKKTEIKSSKEWNEFLGCRFKVINRKTIFTL